MSNGFIKSFDGTRIYYSKEGSGPVLVFCYGLVCSKHHWLYQMEYFKKSGYTVVWFDYRGHHNSDIPHDLDSLKIESVARDAEHLFDELGITQAVLLGHSMGVNIVLEIYKRISNRISALILANGSARAPLETIGGNNVSQLLFPWLEKLHHWKPKLANFLWSIQSKSSLTRYFIGNMGFNPALADPKDIDEYIQRSCELDIVIFLKFLRSYENYDATAWLHQIDVPTLIIAGENDKVIPKPEQELMHQLIPNSQFEIIRNGSHCPQIDIPDLMDMIIERYLNTLKLKVKDQPSSDEISQTSGAQISRQGDVS